MIEPLPDELAQLIAAERTAPVTDAVAQAAVRAKLAIAVGHAPLGAAGIGVAGKVLAILAVVVGAGVGTKLLLDRSAGAAATTGAAQVSTPAVPKASNAVDASAAPPAANHATSAVAPTVTASAATHPMKAPSATPAVATHTAAGHAASTLASPASVTSAEFVAAQLATKSPEAAGSASLAAVPLQPVGASTPTEAELLRQAWATRDASVALELVHRDAALHPDGALVEERIALEIRALADLHRMDEARAIAAQYFIDFPQTVHRAIVERALARRDTP